MTPFNQHVHFKSRRLLFSTLATRSVKALQLKTVKFKGESQGTNNRSVTPSSLNKAGIVDLLRKAAHGEGYRVTILRMRNGCVGPELTLDRHVQLRLGDDAGCSCLNQALLAWMPLGWGGTLRFS